MAFRVLNKTGDLMCIPLSTGAGYYLAPGLQRLDFPDTEVKNAAVQALLARRDLYLEAHVPAEA